MGDISSESVERLYYDAQSPFQAILTDLASDLPMVSVGIFQEWIRSSSLMEFIDLLRRKRNSQSGQVHPRVDRPTSAVFDPASKYLFHNFL